MDLHALTPVLAAEGPFVTGLVDSESDVEQAADEYDLAWRNVLRELEGKGVDQWADNAREIVGAVEHLAAQIDAQLVVLTGDERELLLVRENLSHALRDKVVQVAGGRNDDGSHTLVRRRVADAVARHVATGTLELLADYAQERGQGQRAVDGLPAVVEALRKAQVQTLLITTDTEQAASLWFGPEPTQIATTGPELVELGVADPQEGPMIDVLIRAAIGTAADVQLVPGETESAPQMGVGAVLRYADGLGSSAADQSAVGR